MRRASYIIFMLSSLLWLGVACDGSERPCVRDTDCPFATICEDSRCIAGCFEDGDCGLRHACLDGACALIPLSCTDDRLCPFGYRCNTGANLCEQHADADWLCTDCSLRYCLSSSDCPGNEHCDRPDPNAYGRCGACGPTGSCRFEGLAASCSATAECAAGERCVRPACTQSEDCGDFGFCTSSTYHDDGRLPDLKSCSRGLCYRSFCAKDDCASAGDDACPKGYACFRLIDLQAHVGCEVDTDCPGERFCRYLNEENPIRYCTCLTDGDCAQGECVNGSCVTASQCLPVLGLTCEEVRRDVR